MAGGVGRVVGVGDRWREVVDVVGHVGVSLRHMVSSNNPGFVVGLRGEVLMHASMMVCIRMVQPVKVSMQT